MSEELKPVEPVEEAQPVTVEQPAEEQTLRESVSQVVEDIVDYSQKGLKELIDTFQSLIESDDMQKLHKDAEILKACFYKTLRKEKITAGFISPDLADAPEPAAAVSSGEETAGDAEAGSNPFVEVEKGFKELYAKYRAKRAAFTAELEKKKEENFEKKQEVIGQLKALLEKQDDLKDSFPAFREIQAKWREIGPVAQGKVKDVYETYQHYVEMFYDYVKINKEFRDLDFKKNLEAKVALCEKAEALENEENVVEAFRALQACHEEWKEIGPVEKEFREEIWERFRAATSLINKKHQAYYESLKGDQEENLRKKSALCDRVEEMLKGEIKDSGAWNELTKQIEEIQKEWRTIGFATKKENQKIYDRFRKACDDFFAAKREFYSAFKDQMQENMDKKISLCEAAEALVGSEAWKETADKLIELQKQWKEIGPVSRKKSDQVWKRFRSACDEFFKRRDSEAAAKNSALISNLEAKKSLLEEVVAFDPESSDDPFAALKAFQARWNEIGFVPIREKAKIQTAFKKAMDEKFDMLRGGKSFQKGYQRRSNGGKTLTEREKLIQIFHKKEQEIATLQNNIGFFAKSKNAESFIAEINRQIEAAQAELSSLEAKISETVSQEAE